MITKIKTYFHNIPWQQFNDVRFLGLMVFLVIVLLMTWSGVKSIQTNYLLEKQIAQLEQVIEVQKLKNNNQQLKDAYLNTNQYLELAARQNFGLAAPGETELIVPKNVALAHLTEVSESQLATNSTTIQQSVWQRNLQSWIIFFLHRQNTAD